jgi:hypothetical protein
LTLQEYNRYLDLLDDQADSHDAELAARLAQAAARTEEEWGQASIPPPAQQHRDSQMMPPISAHATATVIGGEGGMCLAALKDLVNSASVPEGLPPAVPGGVRRSRLSLPAAPSLRFVRTATTDFECRNCA